MGMSRNLIELLRREAFYWDNTPLENDALVRS